jgi:glyoxylase I family protein
MDYKEPRRMALRGLHHLTAICQDLDRTTAFYRDVLGLTLVSDAVNADDPTARHFWFGFGGSARTTLVSFMEYPDLEPGQIGVGATHHFAFLVETTEEHQAWFDYLRECGVQCSEIFDRDGFRSLYLRDPDGHIVEIATRGWDFAQA